MRVGVVGGGGREHALCLALSADPAVQTLFCSPGNPGIAAVAELVPITDPVEFAAATRPGLVVIGPEAPLVAGVADRLRAAGYRTFGPSAAAAQIEASKTFAKDVMAAAGVPTAAHHACATPAEVEAALDATGAPYVVKHDGLAAGKGVLVTDDRAAAVRHARGERVVVEEYLDGPELSLFCLSDGTSVLPLLPAQDFKRAYDGDGGPNTGGMGAYCPLGWLPDGLAEEVVKSAVQPVVDELAERGTPFRGLLYAGLALTAEGPKVVEFNARFGDPETQVVLPLLDSPLAALLAAAADGDLASAGPLRWRDAAAVTVVVASAGYPGSPRTGDPIDGLDAAGAVDGVQVLHAGTARDRQGRLVTAGGRVLAVTAVADTVADARESAYRAVEHIRIPGSHHRRDIAATA